MFKIFISLVLLCSFSFANTYSKNYLKNIRTQNPITYKSLLNKYLYYLGKLDDGEPISELENDLLVNSNKNDIAIDIAKIKAKDLIVATKDYAIGIYDCDDLKYAVTFKPNGSVKEVLLLTHSIGNINFRIKRDYEVEISKDVKFLIIKERWDGDREDDVLEFSYKSVYVVILKDAKFLRRDPSIEDLLLVEDKKLNRYYKKLMVKLSQKNKKKLRAIQRVWLKYINLKCSYNILNEKQFKKDCMYKAKELRATELENLYSDLD